MSLKKIEPVVKKVLVNAEESRKDDFVLYGLVLLNMGYDLNKKLGEFLLDAKANKVPSFAGVTRCRRKIFELYPELKDIETTEIRKQQEIECINYSRGED